MFMGRNHFADYYKQRKRNRKIPVVEFDVSRVASLFGVFLVEQRQEFRLEDELEETRVTLPRVYRHKIVL